MPLLDHGENFALNASLTLTLGLPLVVGLAWATIRLPRRIARRPARWALWIGGGFAWALMILLGLAEGAITGLYPPATLAVMLATYIFALLLVGVVALFVDGVHGMYSKATNKETDVTQS